MKKIKTRNAGTMTESAFWGWIRSGLRRLSIRWRPRNEYLISIRRPYLGLGKRSKWEYPCELCQAWNIRAHVECDHRIPCGSLTCAEDLSGFVTRLFVETGGWRCLCRPCHLEVTAGERNAKKLTRK